MKNLNSLLWGQCTEALHQVLRENEYFEDKDMRFDSKWLLNKNNVTNQGIKEERHSNPYDSGSKWIRLFFNFHQAKYESCDKLMKIFQCISSSLKLSGINMTTHSHLTYMEYRNLIKSDSNKSTALTKKEAASSSSEALTAIFSSVQIMTDSNP